MFRLLYQILIDKLRTLKEDINKNLAQGYIQESTSKAGSLVLYTNKADRTKRLYVDYRKLNEITIKDRYALPLIDKLRNRL